ncbi:MAG TPA: hypothetical protein VHA13_00795, partial [Gammaproteobacteria bacterium]|nr:hypothetical protein [Gammaproteobacteria bacterium]
MISDLQRQTSADFCHIIISNGTSAKIKQLVEKIRRTDKRFIYDEIAQEPTTDHASLLINLGKRRRYCLEKYSASWYHFFDADAKIVDDDYIKKLKAQVGKQPQYDIFVNRIIHHGKLSEFPHDFDMANFSFSKKVAKNIPYPIDVDPRFPTGNDWRYFTMISTPTNTYFAND